jgi:hypothetical protein
MSTTIGKPLVDSTWQLLTALPGVTSIVFDVPAGIETVNPSHATSRLAVRRRELPSLNTVTGVALEGSCLTQNVEIESTHNVSWSSSNVVEQFVASNESPNSVETPSG